jgi:hypothetical protein
MLKAHCQFSGACTDLDAVKNSKMTFKNVFMKSMENWVQMNRKSFIIRKVDSFLNPNTKGFEQLMQNHEKI